MNKNSDQTQSNNERFTFFMNNILANNMVWLLKASDGLYAMFEDQDENQYVPVWPERESAERFINGDWENYHTDQMNLKEFKTWLHELKEDKIRIAVFPDPDMTTLSLNPQDLIDQLSQ